ncbi:MAG: hypothetical protein RJB38_1259 [Pseudomonadota bacterium]|jgi:hypothetical protein
MSDSLFFRSRKTAQTLAFVFGIFQALSGLAATEVASSLAPYLDGGTIHLQWEPGASVPAQNEFQIEAKYGRVDPIQPLGVSIYSALASSQDLPLMQRLDGRLLTLQSLTIMKAATSEPAAATRLKLSRNDLEPLRRHARTGATLLLSANNDFSQFHSRVALSSREEFELPARASAPGLAFAEPDPLEWIRLDDLADSLLRMRAVSSASEAYLQELIHLAQKTPAIDVSRLLLLLDAVPFPAAAITAIKQRLRELSLTTDLEEQKKTLEANLALAERLAPLSNRLFMAGILKIRSLKTQEASLLIERLMTAGDSNELAFSHIFEKLGGSFEAFTADQKPAFFSLAIKKNAPQFALQIGQDWFLKDSNRSVTSLLDLIRALPPGALREQLSGLALSSLGSVSVSDFTSLTSAIEASSLTEALYQALLPRVSDLSAEALLTWLAPRPAGALRDRLLLMGVASLTTVSSTPLERLLLTCSSWECRYSVVRGVFEKLDGQPVSVLSAVLRSLAKDPQRDDLLTEVVTLAKSLSLSELPALFSLSLTEKVAITLFDLALVKLARFQVAEATSACDQLIHPAINADGFRDRILLRAAEEAVDLNSANLDSLLVRASSDQVRTKIRKISEHRANWNLF